MGIFRRDKVVDLTEDYHYDRKKSKVDIKDNFSKPEQTSSVSENSTGGFFGNFFGSSGVSSTSSSTTVGEIGNTYRGNFDSETGKPLDSLDAEEKRRRLALRLKNMTDRIEDLSTQLYQLQQRIEVVEKKLNSGRYE